MRWDCLQICKDAMHEFRIWHDETVPCIGHHMQQDAAHHSLEMNMTCAEWCHRIECICSTIHGRSCIPPTLQCLILWGIMMHSSGHLDGSSNSPCMQLISEGLHTVHAAGMLTWPGDQHQQQLLAHGRSFVEQQFYSSIRNDVFWIYGKLGVVTR